MSLSLKPGWSSGFLQRVVFPTHCSQRDLKANHLERWTLPALDGEGSRRRSKAPCLTGSEGLDASE